MAFRISLWTVAASKSGDAPAMGVAQYLQRSARAFPAGPKSFRTEAALLSAAQAERKVGSTACWMADPGGQTLTTEGFAQHVQRLRDGGLRHLILAVGPADGWSGEARAAADFRLSLSAMTLPHELAALVLAEQIYRVSTILLGHPYHLGH